MSYSLDQSISDPANYTVLPCPGTVKVVLQISNGAIQIGFGRGHPAPVYEPDEPYLPVVGTLARRCDYVRVRASAPVPNPPPQVKITAIPGAA